MNEHQSEISGDPDLWHSGGGGGNAAVPPPPPSTPIEASAGRRGGGGGNGAPPPGGSREPFAHYAEDDSPTQAISALSQNVSSTDRHEAIKELEANAAKKKTEALQKVDAEEKKVDTAGEEHKVHAAREDGILPAPATDIKKTPAPVDRESLVADINKRSDAELQELEAQLKEQKSRLDVKLGAKLGDLDAEKKTQLDRVGAKIDKSDKGLAKDVESRREAHRKQISEADGRFDKATAKPDEALEKQAEADAVQAIADAHAQADKTRQNAQQSADAARATGKSNAAKAMATAAAKGQAAANKASASAKTQGLTESEVATLNAEAAMATKDAAAEGKKTAADIEATAEKTAKDILAKGEADASAQLQRGETNAQRARERVRDGKARLKTTRSEAVVDMQLKSAAAGDEMDAVRKDTTAKGNTQYFDSEDGMGLARDEAQKKADAEKQAALESMTKTYEESKRKVEAKRKQNLDKVQKTQEKDLGKVQKVVDGDLKAMEQTSEQADRQVQQRIKLAENKVAAEVARQKLKLRVEANKACAAIDKFVAEARKNIAKADKPVKDLIKDAEKKGHEAIEEEGNKALAAAAAHDAEDRGQLEAEAKRARDEVGAMAAKAAADEAKRVGEMGKKIDEKTADHPQVASTIEKLEKCPEAARDILTDLPPEQYAKVVAGLSEEARKKLRKEEARVAEDALRAANGEEEGLGFGLERSHDKRNWAIQKELEDAPPALRAAALRNLEEKAKGKDAAVSAETLGEIQESAKDLAAREKADKEAAEARKRKINEGVAAAESAAKSPQAMKQVLAGLSQSQEKEALEHMSPEARAAAEASIAKRREKLARKAEKLFKAVDGGGTKEIVIVTELSGLSAKEADELQELYAEKYKDGDGKARSLKGDLKDDLKGGDEAKEREFVTAMLDGEGRTEEGKKLSVDLAVKYIDDEIDAILDTSESSINDLLRVHVNDPEAIEAISKKYKSKTGKSLDAALKSVMDEQEYKEASAYERNDKRSANVARIEQGNQERGDEVVAEVQETPGGLAELNADLKEHGGVASGKQALKGKISDEKLKEVEGDLVLADAHAEADRRLRLAAALEELKKDPKKHAEAKVKMEQLAGQLAGALSDANIVGNNVEVTKLIADLGPGEVALLEEQYAEHMKKLNVKLPGQSSGDLEISLRANLTGKDLKLANAVLSGDKVLVAAARVEQAASGAGTDIEEWRKAMESLTDPKDRIRFKAMMDKHLGGIEGSAYKDLNRSENSSHDRDEMEAQALDDNDDRAGALSAVKSSRGAYGGTLAVATEGLGDEVGDLVYGDKWEGEKRAEWRKGNRTQFHNVISNAGSGEEQIVEANEVLQNPAQVEAYKRHMKQLNGETAEETHKGELSEHKLKLTELFMKGDYEGGLAQKALAAADGYLDDDEDGISSVFEKVRLTKDNEKELGGIKDEKAREERRKELLKERRASLRERLDEECRKAGKGSYDELKKKELDKDQQIAATERERDGEMSDVSKLLMAGDTFLGWGKDAKPFNEILGKMSPKDVADFEARWEKRNPDKKFKGWVRSKATSDGEKRDFEILLEGNYARMEPKELDAFAKEHPEDLIKRVKDLHAAARAGKSLGFDCSTLANNLGGNEIGNRLTDELSGTGKIVDARLAAVQKLEQKIQNKEELSDEEREDLIRNMRYMAGDQQAFTESKNVVTDKVAKGFGTAANVVVTGLTTQAEFGALAQAGVEFGVKDTLNGARVGDDERAAVSIRMGADFVASRTGLGPAFEGFVNGGVNAATDARNLRDVGTAITAIGGGATRGAATGTAAWVGNKVGGDGLLGDVLSSGGTTVATYDPNRSLGDQAGDFVTDLGTGIGTRKASAHGASHKKTAADGPPRKANDEGSRPDGDSPEPRSKVDAPAQHPDAEVPGPQAGSRKDDNKERLHPVSPEALAAKDKLDRGDAKSLTPDEHRALLDHAVKTARRGIIAEGASSGLSADQALSPAELGGFCGPSQGRVANALEKDLGMAGGDVIRHATDPAAAKPGADGKDSKFVTKDNAHFFTVVKIGGEAYLVDPSYAQFEDASRQSTGVSDRLSAAKGGDEIAKKLATDGYIKLDKDVAQAYGQAITGKNETFTVEDYTGEGNANKDNRRVATNDDKRLTDRGHMKAADDYYGDDAAKKQGGGDEPAKRHGDDVDPEAKTLPPGELGNIETQHRKAENKEAVKKRAEDHVEKMEPDDRKEYDKLRNLAGSEAQRVMLERAAAAGRSVGEMSLMADKMSKMTDKEILLHFTGAGIRQEKFACVPASIQIAAAEADPIYAAYLREHPAVMERQQKNFVRAAGDMKTDGTFPSDTEGHPIKQVLATATGADYVHLGAKDQGSLYTDGAFDKDRVHKSIQEAAANGYPVVIGGEGHSRTIVGVVPGPDGTPRYLVHDPESGTRPVHPSELDGGRLDTVMIPKQYMTSDAAPGKHPHDGDEATADTERAPGPQGATKKPSAEELAEQAKIRPADVDQQKAAEHEAQGYRWRNIKGKKTLVAPDGMPRVPMGHFVDQSKKSEEVHFHAKSTEVDRLLAKDFPAASGAQSTPGGDRTHLIEHAETVREEVRKDRAAAKAEYESLRRKPGRTDEEVARAKERLDELNNQVRDLSMRIGETSASMMMDKLGKKLGLPVEKVYGGWDNTSTNGAVDLVYKIGDKYYVIESKGGIDPELTSAEITAEGHPDKGKRAQQGTPQYLEHILAQMNTRSQDTIDELSRKAKRRPLTGEEQKELADAQRTLNVAGELKGADASGNLEYDKVHAKFRADVHGDQHLTEVTRDRFDLSKEPASSESSNPAPGPGLNVDPAVQQHQADHTQAVAARTEAILLANPYLDEDAATKQARQEIFLDISAPLAPSETQPHMAN